MNERKGFMSMSREKLRAIILEQDKIIARSGDQMTDLSSRVIDLQQDLADAVESIKILRSERAELRGLNAAHLTEISSLHDTITSLRVSIDDRAELHQQDNAHSRKVYAKLEKELRKWKVLCAKEVLENCDE